VQWKKKEMLLKRKELFSWFKVYLVKIPFNCFEYLSKEPK
jgi:hypothetical protein